MKALFFTCIAIISQIVLQAQNSVIPLPRNFSQSDEIVYFDPSAVLFQGTLLRAEALLLAHELNTSFGFRLPSVIEVPSRQFIPEGPKIKLSMIFSHYMFCWRFSAASFYAIILFFYSLQVNIFAK